MALDLEILMSNVATLHKSANPEAPELGGMAFVEMADVPIPQEDGSTKNYRRVNWAAYHARVEKDLALLKEAEDAEMKAKEEAAAEAQPPQEDEVIPEGATVFGGE